MKAKPTAGSHPMRRATDRIGSTLQNPSPQVPVFLSPDQLAALLGLPSVETVYQWRRKHSGPPGFRAGRHVRYELAKVIAWIEQRTAADDA